MKPKKQKSVTMWAIKNRFGSIFFATVAMTRKRCWELAKDVFCYHEAILKTQGYHAVKGKFVWEEK